MSSWVPTASNALYAGKISKEELNAGLIKAISKPGQPFPGLKAVRARPLHCDGCARQKAGWSRRPRDGRAALA